MVGSPSLGRGVAGPRRPCRALCAEAPPPVPGGPRCRGGGGGRATALFRHSPAPSQRKEPPRGGGVGEGAAVCRFSVKNDLVPARCLQGEFTGKGRRQPCAFPWGAGGVFKTFENDFFL